MLKLLFAQLYVETASVEWHMRNRRELRHISIGGSVHINNKIIIITKLKWRARRVTRWVVSHHN